MVVYIDSVFLLNACLDVLLLYFTGYLSGAERNMRRIVLAGCLGGLYAVGAFLPWGGLLLWVPVKGLSGAGMVLIAYGARREFFRLFGVFLGLSCVLAGATVACSVFLKAELYHRGALLLPVKLPVLAFSALVCFLFLLWFQRGGLYHRVRGEIVEAECVVNGKSLHLRVLRDSGNTLRDETGAPVLVIEGALAAKCWPEMARECFSREMLRAPERLLPQFQNGTDGTAVRLLPFRSVGVAQGVLLVCRAEAVRIGAYRAGKITLALSPTPVSEMGEYEGLWGGPVK